MSEFGYALIVYVLGGSILSCQPMLSKDECFKTREQLREGMNFSDLSNTGAVCVPHRLTLDFYCGQPR